MEILLSIWRIRLGKPTLRISASSPGSFVTFHREMQVIVLLLINMNRRIPKLIYWEIAVDRPAPSIPSPRPNIRMGSPIMFRTPPDTRPIMARAAFPS